ncbi:hypothetical protein K1719_012336 [Acacia pycnantha]|nr:hypothetical protein K1719_012336 [Acacia pycnantha]
MIKVDRSTSIYDKGEFARICVEVDLQQPLLPAFTVFGEDKQLVYEGLHLVCFGCGLYGHECESCPQRTMADGGNNSGLTNQSVGADVGDKAGHSKQMGVDAGSNREGPKSTVVDADSGSGTENAACNGGKRTNGDPTASMVAASLHCNKKESSKHAHETDGGSKHLGAQMILRRELRRNNNGMAKQSGIKSRATDFSQINRDKGRGGSNGGPGNMELTNEFASLHDLDSKPDGSMNGAMQVDTSKVAAVDNYKNKEVDFSLEKGNDAGETSVNKVDDVIRVKDTNEDQLQKGIVEGYGVYGTKCHLKLRQSNSTSSLCT